MQLQKGNPPDVPHSRADAVTSNKLLVKDAGGDVIPRGTQLWPGETAQEFKHPESTADTDSDALTYSHFQ